MAAILPDHRLPCLFLPMSVGIGAPPSNEPEDDVSVNEWLPDTDDELDDHPRMLSGAMRGGEGNLGKAPSTVPNPRSHAGQPPAAQVAAVIVGEVDALASRASPALHTYAADVAGDERPRVVSFEWRSQSSDGLQGGGDDVRSAMAGGEDDGDLSDSSTNCTNVGENRLGRAAWSAQEDISGQRKGSFAVMQLPSGASDSTMCSSVTEPAGAMWDAHRQGNCRPCPWFWRKDGCYNADSCRHCHYCPEAQVAEHRRAKNRRRKAKTLVA